MNTKKGWELSKNSIGTFYVDDIETGAPICSLLPNSTIPDQKENAVLICAAPKLLKAVQSILIEKLKIPTIRRTGTDDLIISLCENVIKEATKK